MIDYKGSEAPRLEVCIDTAIASHTARPKTGLNLDDAAWLAHAVREEAEARQVPVVFSLVDAHGHQRYFFSMEEALLISHRLAPQKAWTAVALKMATHELGRQVQPAMGLHALAADPGICWLGGGLPCWSQGQLLGGIGVSGGTAEQDIAIARAAILRFSASRYPLVSA
ncbi:heme-binding protein [Pantoea sp. MBD-2R]|uniref:GlcG/HbpS family heme-binding protein n=1 Tax=Pantoea sp. MBD-2R TaxID=3141540 RepID=UPI0031843D70